MKKQKGSGIRRPFVNRRNRLMLGNGKRKIKGSGATRPFINKRNCLMLGNGKRTIKQRGGFLGQVVAALTPAVFDLLRKI